MGQNSFGQLGLCNSADRSSPAQVSLPGPAKSIFIGGTDAFVELLDGRVFGWGSNMEGELGDGTQQNKSCPERLPAFDNAVQIAPGAGNTFAIGTDGTVLGVGVNNAGQLGTTPPPSMASPPIVTSPAPVGGTTTNDAPKILQAASVSPSPLNGTVAAVSVTADDPNDGEPALTYKWSGVGPGIVHFGPSNNSNGGKNTSATFNTSGNYVLKVTVTDPAGVAVTSHVSLVVNISGQATVGVSPGSVSVRTNATQQFTATDQSGSTLTSGVTWSVSGGGNITTSGLFTAGVQAGGPYIVSALSGGITGTAQVTVTQNTPPVVSLTGPVDNAVFNLGDTISLQANASDSDGSIRSVDFLQGSTVLGSATHAPYSFSWTPTQAGPYQVSARATDNQNGIGTSGVVHITVRAPAVTVSPSAVSVPPTGTQQFTATDQSGSAILSGLSWTVSGGGSISSSGLFTAGTQAGGPYTVTATRAGISGTATLTVTASTPPTISLTSPVDNATYHLGDAISLRANASDSDGTISQVDFFQGTTLVASVTGTPFAAQWIPTQPGIYHVSARATDNDNAIGTSASVLVNIVGVVPVLSGLTPEAKSEGDGAFVLTASGNQLDSSTVLLWNGTTRVTDYVDSTHLQAHILASDLVTPGFYPVSLSGASGSSHSISFEVVSRVDNLQWVNVTDVMPLSASLKAVANHGVAASYQFTFTPNARRAGSPSAILGRAGAFTAASPDGSLALNSVQNLVPGSYHVSVTAQNRLGQVSAPAEADITVVGSDLSQARVYPNPYRSDRYSDNQMIFDRLTQRSTIKVFTVSGQFVKKLDASSGSATWDLTNDSGDRVASGIYLYLITNDQGQKAKGKLALIR